MHSMVEDWDSILTSSIAAPQRLNAKPPSARRPAYVQRLTPDPIWQHPLSAFLPASLLHMPVF
jgi:hypothetical protein